MSELTDCINSLSAKDIIKSVAKTANGVPFYLQTSGLVGLGDELIINGRFLVDTSDWFAIGATISRVTNYNGEATSGQIDATGVSATLRQQDFSPPYLENGKTYRIEVRSYIPSTNTKCDGWRIRFLGSTSQWTPDVIAIPADTWTTTIFEYTSIGLSERFYIYMYDGPSTTIAIGDDIYFALISVREIL